LIARRSALAGVGAALLAHRSARARRFLTMMTAAPAGTSGDEIARSFALFLGRLLDGPEIQVRNVPGDGGWAALNKLANAPPSGGTVGWVTSPVLPARSVDRADPRLPSRLTLLGTVLREPIAFVASAAAPLDSIRDMIDRAGQDSGALPLGTPPPGSPSHLAVLRLQAMTQTRLTIMAFPSAAAARQALLGGNVTAAALGLSDVIAALRDARLVGLGIAARQRVGILPDMPILAEAGVPLSALVRRGLAVPADTPPDLTAPLIEALRAVADDAGFKEQAEALGLEAAWDDGPTWASNVKQEAEELAALWAADPWLNAAGQ
jgi:tripartite-type tricarboxylate transporter receptor subunit TctC